MFARMFDSRAFEAMPFFLVWLSILLGVGLSSCTSIINIPFQNEPPREEDSYAEAEGMVSRGDYLEAAGFLWHESAIFEPPSNLSMQLESIRILLDGFYPLLANEKLQSIRDESLSIDTLATKRLLQTQVYFQTDQLEFIEAILTDTLIAQATPGKQELMLLYLADAHASLGEWFLSVQKRVQADEVMQLLKRSLDLRTHNLDKLWSELGRCQQKKVEAYLAIDLDPSLRAWFTLVTLTYPSMRTHSELVLQLYEWQEQNVDLPISENVLKDIRKRWVIFDFQPQKVAVMLPFTGRFGKYGKSVQLGIESAKSRDSNPLPTEYYNTDQDISVTDLYRQAMASGADVVVGPLTRANVEKLAKEVALFGAPVLALNYVDTDIQAPSNMYQFGLLPEDEAEFLAYYLWRGLEKRNVAVISPQTAWGDRMAGKFSEVLTFLGGTVVSTAKFGDKHDTYAELLKRNLGVSSSEGRFQLLYTVLGRDDIHFHPHINNDIEAIVLFSAGEDAATIHSLIKFYYAGKLPVLSSSRIFSPEKRKPLQELNGIIFSEIPLVFERKWNPAHGEASQEPFSGSKFIRLYALGIDAYNIIRLIKRLEQGLSYGGKTGTLNMLDRLRVQRKPWLGRITDGFPVLYSEWQNGKI